MRYPGGMVARVFLNGTEQSDSAIVYIELTGVTRDVKTGDLVRTLNAKAIEEEALARLTWGGGYTISELVLQVVAEKLDAS